MRRVLRNRYLYAAVNVLAVALGAWIGHVLTTGRWFW